MVNAQHARLRNDRREQAADCWIHALGLGLALAATPAVIYLAIERADPRLLFAIAVYALGLLTMLTCSALYNMTPASPRRQWLRRFDHAAIFVMIAATYTPFLLVRMAGEGGWSMLVFVWLIAAAGACLALFCPRRFERLQLATYLLLGWSIVALWGPFAAQVAASAIGLLLIGGLLYSFGVLFHLWHRLRYHTALWHGFVLGGASCHYAAVLLGVVLTRS